MKNSSRSSETNVPEHAHFEQQDADEQRAAAAALWPDADGVEAAQQHEQCRQQDQWHRYAIDSDVEAEVELRHPLLVGFEADGAGSFGVGGGDEHSEYERRRREHRGYLDRDAVRKGRRDEGQSDAPCGRGDEHRDRAASS